MEINNNNNSKLLFTEAKHVDDILLIGSLSNHDNDTENNDFTYETRGTLVQDDDDYN